MLEVYIVGAKRTHLFILTSPAVARCNNMCLLLERLSKFNNIVNHPPYLISFQLLKAVCFSDIDLFPWLFVVFKSV